MSRVGTCVVVGLLLLSTVLGGVSAETDNEQNALPGAQIDPTSVSLAVDIEPNGTAHWDVTYRVRLGDENATAAFESLREDIEANRTAYIEQFADRMRPTVAGAADAAGREMALQNVTVSTSREALPQEYGVVTYRFEWTNFAVVNGDQLRFGDAIAGLFLDRESTLIVRWPAEYTAVSISPTPDQQSVTQATWTGPSDFPADEPRVVLGPSSAETGEADGPTRSATRSLVVPVVLSVVVLGGLVAGGVGYRRRTRYEPTHTDHDHSSADSPDALLSNEEQVLALLESHDGRLRQQRVAEALGWTDAKTSQVVSSMREAGTVETFRLGRENVVSLPEEPDI